jgi:hypothetical protein
MGSFGDTLLFFDCFSFAECYQNIYGSFRLDFDIGGDDAQRLSFGIESEIGQRFFWVFLR